MAQAMQIVFGQSVRDFRAAAGLHQRDVADQAGLTQQRVSKIENGEINVTVLTMCRLAIAVGGDVSTMITARGQAE